MESDRIELPVLDIQEVSIRLLRIFNVVNQDETGRTKSQVKLIEEDVPAPGWYLPTAFRAFPTFPKLRFNRVRIGTTRRKIPMAEETFFNQDVKFENNAKREDWFWKINLRSSNHVSSALIKLTSALAQEYQHDHFVAKTMVDGKYEERKMEFCHMRNVSISQIYLPENILMVEGKDETPSFYYDEEVIHFLICLNMNERNPIVFDPTAMKFGHRGQRGEIVGMIETFSDYKSRFPGIIMSDLLPANDDDPQAESSPINPQQQGYTKMYNARGMEIYSPDPDSPIILDEEESRKIFEERERARASPTTPDIEERMIERFMKELKDGVVWCVYCGKSLDEPLKCQKCKKKSYCGRNCQTAHWKSHKKSCAEVPSHSGDF